MPRKKKFKYTIQKVIFIWGSQIMIINTVIKLNDQAYPY